MDARLAEFRALIEQHLLLEHRLSEERKKRGRMTGLWGTVY